MVKKLLQFSDVLASTLDKRQGHSSTEKLNLVIFVESAVGLLNLQDTCKRGIQLSETRPFHLDGVVFGSDDFCADIGIEYYCVTIFVTKYQIYIGN